MAVMVQYKDNSFGHVRNSALDELIGAGRIVAFRRGSGWVEIGSDPLRTNSAPAEFAGMERRSALEKKSCLTCPDFVDALCRHDLCQVRFSRQGKSA
ncbi:MAG: hypothetical protein NDI77_12945 [Geobacteraceae bacterium]|nr:hypothetical protein [Geobacteraceae bacterium]